MFLSNYCFKFKLQKYKTQVVCPHSPMMMQFLYMSKQVAGSHFFSTLSQAGELPAGLQLVKITLPTLLQVGQLHSERQTFHSFVIVWTSVMADAVVLASLSSLVPRGYPFLVWSLAICLKFFFKFISESTCLCSEGMLLALLCLPPCWEIYWSKVISKVGPQGLERTAPFSSIILSCLKFLQHKLCTVLWSVAGTPEKRQL